MKAFLRRLAGRLPILYALESHLPAGVRARLGSEGGDSASARYCYSVWLRHLCKCHEHGLPTDPRSVGELGPGDSLGVGMMALLTGADEYHALDVIRHSAADANLRMLDALVELLASREAIPGQEEFPDVLPIPGSYEFPRGILTQERLGRGLEPRRVEAIRTALRGETRADGVQISYHAPWSDLQVLRSESLDFIVAQAVLEHVDALPQAYEALRTWLKPGGVLTTVIDYRSHNRHALWNGHYAYSDGWWRVLRGRREYLLNRQPHSAHLGLMREAGLEVVADEQVRQAPEAGLRRAQLAPRFRHMSDDDLCTSGALLQAVRPPVAKRVTDVEV